MVLLAERTTAGVARQRRRWKRWKYDSIAFSDACLRVLFGVFVVGVPGLEGFGCFLAEFDNDVVHEVIDHIHWRDGGQIGCGTNTIHGRVDFLFYGFVVSRRYRQWQPMLEVQTLHRATYVEVLVRLAADEIKFALQSALASSPDHIDPDAELDSSFRKAPLQAEALQFARSDQVKSRHDTFFAANTVPCTCEDQKFIRVELVAYQEEDLVRQIGELSSGFSQP